MMPLLVWVEIGGKGKTTGLPENGLAAQQRCAHDTAPRRHGRLRAGQALLAVIAEFSTPLS
jgi:hypothetical protein